MSYEEDLAAVVKNGYELFGIQDQTEEMCLSAVKQSGWFLMYAKEQTPELIRATIEQFWIDGMPLPCSIKNIIQWELLILEE
jgi:hypothetical protein